MAPRRRAPSLAGLAIVLSSIWSATALPDVPTIDNYLHRVWAKATVLGNYVYIEGGEINQLVDGKKLSTAADVGMATPEFHNYQQTILEGCTLADLNLSPVQSTRPSQSTSPNPGNRPT